MAKEKPLKKTKPSARAQEENLKAEWDEEPAAFLPVAYEPAGKKLPVPEGVRGNATINQVRDADMQVMDMMFHAAWAAWGGVKDIDTFQTMLAVTKGLIRDRRDMLGLHYGPEGDTIPGVVPTPRDPLKPQ